MASGSCETCFNNIYDEESDSYYCMMDLDEDEFYSYCLRPGARCPYYRPGGEEGGDEEAYRLAGKQ